MDQELIQYLDERFGRVDQRFDGVDQRFDRIEHRLDEHDQQFAHIDGRFRHIDERLDEVKRHAGVLVEGMRHDVRLLAEGFDTFINVRYARDQTRIDERFREMLSLMQLSYDQLRQRIENHERKERH